MKVPSLSSLCGRSRQVVEGTPSWWSDSYCRETPTVQYIIYNIKRNVWNSCRLPKTTQQYVTWSSSSPPPTPKNKPSGFGLLKTSLWSHRQSPSVNPVHRTPTKGSTPRTSKRPHVDVIKNTHPPLSQISGISNWRHSRRRRYDPVQQTMTIRRHTKLEYVCTTRNDRDCYLFRVRKMDMEIPPDTLESDRVKDLFVTVTVDTSFTTSQWKVSNIWITTQNTTRQGVSHVTRHYCQIPFIIQFHPHHLPITVFFP